MHANAEGESTGAEWDAFFARAQQSDLFRGGSAMGKRWTIGKQADTLSDGLTGFLQRLRGITPITWQLTRRKSGRGCCRG